jgi:hypothetical protein
VATRRIVSRPLPRWAAALVLGARLTLTRAHVRPAERRALAVRAAADFEQAFAINGNLTPVWSARVAEARRLAAQP